MMQPEIELDDQLRNYFELLKPVPARDPRVAERRRAEYLTKVKGLRQKAVSVPVKPRHKVWKTLFPTIPNLGAKEYQMIKIMLAIVLSLALLFGSGEAAFAVQNSLPGDVVYPVKIWGEQVQVSLASDTQSKFELTQEFANRRVEELVILDKLGQQPPLDAALNLNNYLNTSLQLAAGMDDQAMTQALEQVHTQARVQQLIMAQTSQDGSGVMEQVRSRLQEQVRLCEMGLADPQGFRAMVRQRFENQQRNVPTGTPGPQGTPSPANAGPGSTTSPNGGGAGQGGPSSTPGSGGGAGQGGPNSTPGSGGGGVNTPTQQPGGGGQGPGGGGQGPGGGGQGPGGGGQP
ncbi:MAG: DUF5667 domain-containing protein [Chloroflexota bacterium]